MCVREREKQRDHMCTSERETVRKRGQKTVTKRGIERDCERVTLKERRERDTLRKNAARNRDSERETERDRKTLSERKREREKEKERERKREREKERVRYCVCVRERE